MHEGLGVADTGEETVVTRGGEGSLADIFFGDEEASALRLSGVLRAIGEERLEALLDEWRDVDDEAGTDIRVEARVKNLEGTMRCRR